MENRNNTKVDGDIVAPVKKRLILPPINASFRPFLPKTMNAKPNG